MGNKNVKSFVDKWNGKQKVKLLILGFDGAGKTTLLYRIKLGEVIAAIPSCGFNIESFDYGKLHITAWDVSAKEKIRRLFNHYFKEADALVYVVDSANKSIIEQCKDELHSFMGYEESKNIPLLVMANKQDLPNVMTVGELTIALDLNSIIDHSWHVQACCVINDTGINEGLDWVHSQLVGKTAMKW